jgi:hypothetical protein
MKIKLIVLLLPFLISILPVYLNAQCGGCNAAFSGSTLAAGTSNIGVLKENSFRAISVYRFLYGSNFYKDTERLKKFDDEELNIHFMGFNLAYGLTKSFTVETEFGGFLQKDLNMGYDRTNISGLSSIAVIGKYTLLADRKNKQELTLSAGGRAPMTHNTTLSGNFGAIFQLFYFKNLIGDLNLIFLNRNEIYFSNKNDYRQGNSYITSIFLSQPIANDLNGILEFRYDYFDKSYEYGEIMPNAGRDVLFVAPQINYTIGKISLSFITEIPVYKQYSGLQLGEDFGLGLAFIYMM